MSNKRIPVSFLCLALPALLGLFGCYDTSTFDVIIANGTIVDGTGKPEYKNDVGILGDTIVKIGNLSRAKTGKRIDASGLIVAPGFIDAHSHSDRAIRSSKYRANENFIRQGVTTCLFGVDGFWNLKTAESFFKAAEKNGVGTNWAFYAGHNGIRQSVMRMENRAPTPEELDKMKSLVKKAMEMGAIGLSSGLMYLPGRFAATEEVVELAKVVAPYDGAYDSHVRDPVNDFIGSVRECIEIGEKSGARPHPAHHKAVGISNWGKSKDVSVMIQAAIDRGLDVTVDQYPYDGAATAPLIAVLVPPEGVPIGKIGEALRDPEKRKAIQKLTEDPPPEVYSWVQTVGYDSFRIVVCERFPDYEGEMLVDISKERNVDPFAMIVDIVTEDPETLVTLGACSEDDVRYIMTRSWTVISSDGGSSASESHPRSYGTFPRVLGRYVREWKVLSLEEAVHKMSGKTAKYFRLEDRGEIKEGCYADIAIFDPERIIDRSDWAHPNVLAEGVIHVLVNGVFALESEEMTENLGGKFIPFKGGIYIEQTTEQ
ncbi:MAG: D-aminoacylase [Candidatus Aminicenantes bacterium]|nr:D-aminoacylase [Candidatus Aminicenantes bacterium]